MVMPDHIRINPAFRRRPEEAEIIGRLVVGFSEIELAASRNAGKAMKMHDSILRALYRQRSTSSRIDTAAALMEEESAKVGLRDLYEKCAQMVRHCLKIRNQFAHCNWADDPETPGLFFADLQTSAESPPGKFEHTLRHVDAALLQTQEVYFSNTMEWLDFLDHELAEKQGRLGRNIWPRPPELDPPPAHNPPAQYIPQWLDEDQRALHLARAMAAQGGPPTPTPAQQALDRAREEKRALRQAQKERSDEGERLAKGGSSENPE
jgi:hypothetical protein